MSTVLGCSCDRWTGWLSSLLLSQGGTCANIILEICLISDNLMPSSLYFCLLWLVLKCEIDLKLLTLKIFKVSSSISCDS